MKVTDDYIGYKQVKMDKSGTVDYNWVLGTSKLRQMKATHTLTS